MNTLRATQARRATTHDEGVMPGGEVGIAWPPGTVLIRVGRDDVVTSRPGQRYPVPVDAAERIVFGANATRQDLLRLWRTSTVTQMYVAQEMNVILRTLHPAPAGTAHGGVPHGVSYRKGGRR